MLPERHHAFVYGSIVCLVHLVSGHVSRLINSGIKLGSHHEGLWRKEVHHDRRIGRHGWFSVGYGHIGLNSFRNLLLLFLRLAFHLFLHVICVVFVPLNRRVRVPSVVLCWHIHSVLVVLLLLLLLILETA